MYAEFMAELCRFMIDARIATAETIRGCSDSEIAEVQRQLSTGFPRAVVEWLRHMGHACGNLMDGDAFGLNSFAAARAVAREITSEPDAPWRLPDQAIPLLQHQGYEFLFLYANSDDDPPVWLYLETEPEPRQWALSFTAWLRESAIDAVEHKPWNDEVCREIGLHRDDWTARKRTLDQYDNEARLLRRSLIARLIQNDRKRRRITGPTEMQQVWNRQFRDTDLYRKLMSEQKRVPWGWINPNDA
jgi:hypothetical protein